MTALLLVISLFLLFSSVVSLAVEFTFSHHSGVLHPNPYKGLSTYYNTAEYEHNFVYNRVYWHQFESTKGVYDWSYTDSLLQVARNSPFTDNSMVAFRLMPFAGPGEIDDECPAWLRSEMGDSNGVFASGVWFPDQSHSSFVDGALRAIEAFGQKYNNDPRVAHIDIGMLGFWGEWDCHVPCMFPGTAVQQQIIDAHYEAFPNKIIVQLVTWDEVALEYSWNRGSGYRADMFGYWDPGWSHMVNWYPSAMASFGERWKTVPVHYEIASVLQVLVDNGWDMERTWELGLEWHTTSLNLKDAPITPSIANSPEFLDFLDRMGYKIHLSSVDIMTSGASNVRIASSWSNEGVAPPYLGFSIEYRITKADLSSLVLTSPTKLGTNLLPDEPVLVVDEVFPAGGLLTAAELQSLRVCVFYPVEAPNRVKIHLDVQVGRDSDGCYTTTGTVVPDPVDCPGTPECSAHGTCMAGAPPYCSCDSGWTDSACSTMDCPGSPDCSGQGTCTDGSPPFCTCDTDWQGEECNHEIVPGAICNGIPSEDPTTCSGRGTCSGSDICQCDDGYSGRWCDEEVMCGGTSALDPAVCSGNGVCLVNSVCQCNPGSKGELCETTSSGLSTTQSALVGVGVASVVIVVIILIVVSVVVAVCCAKKRREKGFVDQGERLEEDFASPEKPVGVATRRGSLLGGGKRRKNSLLGPKRDVVVPSTPASFALPNTNLGFSRPPVRTFGRASPPQVPSRARAAQPFKAPSPPRRVFSRPSPPHVTTRSFNVPSPPNRNQGGWSPHVPVRSMAPAPAARFGRVARGRGMGRGGRGIGRGRGRGTGRGRGRGRGRSGRGRGGRWVGRRGLGAARPNRARRRWD